MEYRLKDIDNDLWKKFKVKCIQEGITQRGAILRLIGDWLKQKKGKDK